MSTENHPRKKMPVDEVRTIISIITLSPNVRHEHVRPYREKDDTQHRHSYFHVELAAAGYSGDEEYAINDKDKPPYNGRGDMRNNEKNSQRPSFQMKTTNQSRLSG